METFRYKVVLEIEVDAFDDSDAWEAIEDEFGVGEQMGVRITSCEYKELKKPRKK